MPYTALKDYRLYLDIPEPIFRARVNMASASYPATELVFDTVTLGTYDLIQPDMTLVLGSALSQDDLGRIRVQKPATSTTIPIGRVSQGVEDGTLNIIDDAYIEVWDDYRVWARIPYEAPDGTSYKDANEPVGDFNEELPPVSNCGVGAIDYIDPDTGVLEVEFPSGGFDISYTMADGATITDYTWDVKDGTITVGAATDPVITATFPPGKRWVGLTVEDDNGKQHTSRCLVVAIDPDDDPTAKFTVEGHRIEKSGQTIAFSVPQDIPRSTYPDGCLVIFFADSMLSPTDRSNIKFYGWLQSETSSIRATPTGLVRDTILNCVDVAGRLATLPGFPQALERGEGFTDEDDVTTPHWAYMPTLDMRKCLWYLAFWHSTALSLADFFLPDDLADYPAMRLDSTGASLYEQINSRAQSCVPDHWFTCNTKGQLSVLPDWMLLDFDDRPADTPGTLTETYWSDLQVDYTRPPRVYVLNSGAVECSTDWLILGGEETLPLLFCKAPGYAFGQGVSEATTGEKLAQSQEQLNSCEGHRYARLNARYGPFSIVEPTGDVTTFEPAAMQPVGLVITAATAAQRGLDFTTARGLVKSIDMEYNDTEFGTWVRPRINWEKEVIGLPAVTHIPDVPDDPDYEVPEPPPVTVPPDFGLIDGQQLVAGIGLDGYIYRTSDFQTDSGSGGPTWDRVDTTIADTIYSFVVDPFSPGYITGSGAINGWIVNDTDIYRVTDLFGTVVATSVYTFDEPTVAASFHWRSIQASFGAYFAEGVNPWLVCVSYYGDTSGHEGTWATYSTDGGATWSDEVQISAHYNTATPTRFTPIGVYASPKTPGLAYTAAYSETAEDALAIGYVSTNWGASWTAYTDINAGSGNAGSIHLPWPDNDSEGVFYHGQLITTVEEGTPEELLPRWAIWSDLDNTSFSLLDPGISAGLIAEVSVTGSLVEDEPALAIIPPANTKRVNVEVIWDAARTSAGGFGSNLCQLQISNPTFISQTGASNFANPPTQNSTSSGSFATTHNFSAFASSDWPLNRDSVISSPPTTPAGLRWRPYVNANSSGPVKTATVSITVVVSEIELDDGTIYTPTMPTGARSIRLKRIVDGASSDISPTDGTRLYGVNKGNFGVRTFDSNRQYVLAAVVGNDVTGDAEDNFHAVYISDDFGASWTEVVAPIADSADFANRSAFEAAFGGGAGGENILFIWGPPEYISYSDDQGATTDSRAGNLSSFSPSAWCGIAGGPSA